jgi:hypothetical protein
MTLHHPTLTRPNTYHVQYSCTCGWTSDTRPSTELNIIGAQLIRHMAAEGDP